MIKKIKQQLNNSLQKYTGDRLSEDCLEQIAKQANDVLSKFEHKSLIDNHKMPEADLMWNKFSFFQKIIWFFKNKLNFGRKEIDVYLDGYYTADEDDRYPYEKQYLKYWYNDDPQRTVVVDFEMQLAHPMKYINVSFKAPEGATLEELQEIADELVTK